MYEIQNLKNEFANALSNIQSYCEIEMCTEKGINIGRNIAKKYVSDGGYIPKAKICYAQTLFCLNIFYSWWDDNMPGCNRPIIDDNSHRYVFSICSKASPKSAAGGGALAGALGGFGVGGVWGALAGAAIGAYAGGKLTEEATGEAYYSILREAIGAMFSCIYSEVSKQIDYSSR